MILALDTSTAACTAALLLPELLRVLECKPVYIRAPDARPKAA